MIGLAYLIGWLVMLSPILSNDLGRYNSTLDPQLRLLQFAGLVLILTAGAAVWSAWQTMRKSASLGTKIASVLVALALLDIVWLGVAFKMISLSVDY